MEQELDYAQMLEIPVSTVSVVKKKSFFKRKPKAKEDLKDMVVESVNERVGADAYESENYYSFASELNDDIYARTEDLSEKPEKTKLKTVGERGGSKIVFIEAVAACLIAGGIFVTNMLVQNTAINTFMGSLTAVKQQEAAYTDFTLTSVVSELSDAEITQTEDGVLCFTDEASVYPVCKGEIKKITENEGVFTVEIAHTSTFTSVVSGLSTVYSGVGDTVASNLPFAYSDGNTEVRVAMYDGETLLNCYKLSGAVPVWNS